MQTDFRQATLPDDVRGIIHLAGVSRVVDGQQDPRGCWNQNVNALARLLGQARARADPPWIVYSSSREVYGEPRVLPVKESHVVAPVNVYGRSKVAAEALVTDYGRATARPSQVLRFSNVYGHPKDHATRVVPAFIRASLAGQAMVLHGGQQLFDFTHVEDAAKAVAAAVKASQEDRQLPTMHILPGQGSTLQDLASHVSRCTGNPPEFRIEEPRAYDVTRFQGDPSLTQQELDLECKILLEEGIERLVARWPKAEALLCE